ncbi:MAG: NUDIX domain-containing protein [Candidatus Taylorbacteria bacterium]
MIINSSFISRISGLKWDAKYEELDSFDSIRSLPKPSKGGAAGAFCFCVDKLVIVYANKRKAWEIPGGGLEEGEIIEECITREIKEETNMKVLELFPLGYDTLTNPETQEKIYQLRFVAKVEPYGPFVADLALDGDITEVKLIDPNDYKKYFDWGERGDAMMKKAMKLIYNTSI